MAGVSVATVSNVINNTKHVTAETRARVERAIARTGYVPNQAARTLARQRNGEQTAPRRKGSEPAIIFVAGERRRGDKSPAVSLGRMGNALRALRVVRAAQPVSRSELARRLDIHRSTVTEIVAPLLTAGVLREESPEQDCVVRAGRPPVGLSFRDGRGFIAGVSVGVRQTQVGASTPGGRRLGEVEFETPAEPAAAMELVRSAVEHLRAVHTERNLRCVSVSVPGMVDAERSRLLYAPHLGWRDLEVANGLRLTGDDGAVAVVVENDSTAAAIFEARRRLRDGAGEWEDFALVRVGTGIGVGLVLGGEVFRGAGVAGGMAGEFGHMTIVAGGKPCVCGNCGCWERYAAEPGAVSLYTGERPAGGAVQFADVIARAKAGERRARAVLGRVGEYLGVGIGNVLAGLGLAHVVVSGRIAGAWEFVREPLNQAVARSLAGRVAGLSVEPSEPVGAGLGGALEVAAEHYLTTLAAQNGAA